MEGRITNKFYLIFNEKMYYVNFYLSIIYLSIMESTMPILFKYYMRCILGETLFTFEQFCDGN